jgi:hypothetical protein
MRLAAGGPGAWQSAWWRCGDAAMRTRLGYMQVQYQQQQQGNGGFKLI